MILSSRREKELISVKQKLNILEENIFVLPSNLTDINNMDSYSQKVISKFGKIDILINNGGISQHSLVTDTAIEIDRKIMEVLFLEP